MSTPHFLEVLAQSRVRATFFVIGSSLAADVPLGREMVAAGHELAVHGWDHRLLLARGTVETREGLRRAHGLVGDLTGRPPRWYRPPYGVATTSALHAANDLGMRPVLWTAWGRDWARRATPGTVRRSVLRVRQAGGTVLLHDADTYAARVRGVQPSPRCLACSRPGTRPVSASGPWPSTDSPVGERHQPFGERRMSGASVNVGWGLAAALLILGGVEVAVSLVGRFGIARALSVASLRAVDQLVLVAAAMVAVVRSWWLTVAAAARSPLRCVVMRRATPSRRRPRGFWSSWACSPPRPCPSR